MGLYSPFVLPSFLPTQRCHSFQVIQSNHLIVGKQLLANQKNPHSLLLVWKPLSLFGSPIHLSRLWGYYILYYKKWL